MVIVAKDKDIQIERLELGPWGTNAYILVCQQTRESVVVDVPADAGIMEKLRSTTPKYILMTHNHIDHTGGLRKLVSRLKVPVAAHISDARGLPMVPQILLDDGDIISFGNIKLETIHTPGHTEGSLCFRAGQYLVAGDTIFPGGPGKTVSPANLRQITKSIAEKIMVLPDDTLIFPGHGEPATLKKSKEEFVSFSSRPHDPNLCGDVLWLSS